MIKDKNTASLSIFFKMLAIGILLIDLFVIVLSVGYLRNSRHQAEQRAAVTSQNLSQVLEQYVGGFIDKIDMILVDIADEVKKMNDTGNIDGNSLTSLLAEHQRRLPTLESLRITDAQGTVRYGLGVPQGSKVNLSDRDFFIGAYSDTAFKLVISKPVFARISKKWVVALARRIDYSDGSFAGIVYANIALEHITKIFSSIDVGPNGGISLRNWEMAIITRYPQPKIVGSDIGNKNISPELRRRYEAGQTFGTFFTPTSFDNMAKYVSYRKITNYPLYVVVGIAANDYLRDWKHELTITSTLVVIFIIGTFVFMYLSYKFTTYREQAEEDLQSKTKQLQSLTKDLEQTVDCEIKLRQQNEQLLIQQSKMATIGEMIGMIVHQWKQPLNALSLNIYDIKDAYEYGELDKEYIDKTVSTTREQVNFMIRTIDDFRNFLLPIKEKINFNVITAIEELLYMLGSSYKKNDLEISLETTNTELTPITIGYPNEFKQVILNLMNNSRDAILYKRIKSSSDFTGKINMIFSESNGEIIISITDNGGGIPEDIRDKIFEPYFSTKFKEQGTGLGLFISKTIIEKNMGGKLLTRNIEEGTEFIIKLIAVGT
ncbi:MAG: hypothetical protein HQL06_09095 [Nitrospirae bacterium]|nr:hypothetical protein [Nitrospirota bacterium]